MHVNDLDLDILRRLAGLRPNGARVLSVYLDLDPAEFGTQPARAAQIGSLLDEADRRARDADLAHDARVALRADVERVGALLRGDGFAPQGARAMAIFACGPAGLFEVLRLPDAVPHAVMVEQAPWLDPLIGRDRRQRCLALVSRRTLRAFADGPDGELRELVDLMDDVHGQHDQGGWSQARYERSVEQDVHEHLERSARALKTLWRRRRFELLAIGTSAELWHDFERELDPALRERVVGRFDVDVEHASAEEALAAAQPLLDDAEEQRVRELLGRLQAGVGSGERVAIGIAPVLQALTERRVEALLYEAGFQAPGYVDPASGWLGENVTQHPRGGEGAHRQDNVLDAAIAAALLQSAEVVTLRDRPELGPLGRIAAILRF